MCMIRIPKVGNRLNGVENIIRLKYKKYLQNKNKTYLNVQMKLHVSQEIFKIFFNI